MEGIEKSFLNKTCADMLIRMGNGSSGGRNSAGDIDPLQKRNAQSRNLARFEMEFS
jgi:hypothetical protein